MFEVLFFTFLRSIAVPIVAFLLLRETYLGEAGSFLAITIALTLVNVFVIISQIIKIFPTILLLHTERVIGLILSIIIEIICIITFWSYYLINYSQ